MNSRSWPALPTAQFTELKTIFFPIRKLMFGSGYVSHWEKISGATLCGRSWVDTRRLKVISEKLATTIGVIVVLVMGVAYIWMAAR